MAPCSLCVFLPEIYRPVAPNKYPLDKFWPAARLVSFATKGNAGRKMLSLLALASSGALLQSSLRVTDQGSARTAVVPRAHSRCSLTGFDAGWVRHDARFSKIGFDLIQVLNWNRKIAASVDSATASADNVAASSNSVAGSSNTRRTGSPSVAASIFATGILMVGAQAGNPPWQHVASLLGAVAVAARGYYIAASSNAEWLEHADFGAWLDKVAEGSHSVGASIFATGILVVGAQVGNPPWQRAASLLGAIVVYNQRALGQILKQLVRLRRAISPEDLPSQNTRLRRIPCCCPPAPAHPCLPPRPILIAPVRLPRSDHRAIAPILDVFAVFLYGSLYFAIVACLRLVGGVFDLYDLLRRRPESEAQAEPRERDCFTNCVLCAFLLAVNIW